MHIILFSAQYVAFTVHSPTPTLPFGDIPIFTHIITNVGGGYNNNTGIFTCPVSGLYQFSITLGSKANSSATFVTKRNSIKDTVYCYINYNNDFIGYVDSVSKTPGYNQGSQNIYVEMHKGESIHLLCFGWKYVHTGAATMFSGALVSNEKH